MKEAKDVSGLVYQLIKKVNLLTKRVEELENGMVALAVGNRGKTRDGNEV